MNSGCYGNDISKVLISINVIDMNKCEEKEIKSEEIDFFIEEQIYLKFIITSAKLKGKTDTKQSIEKKQKDLIEKKNYLNQVK